MILVPAVMLFSLFLLGSSTSPIVKDGRATIAESDLDHDKLIPLDGQWEFYWNRLLMPDTFTHEPKPQIDSFMKVPGVWSDHKDGYTHMGTATYRLLLNYPVTVENPALRVQNVANAYQLYINGELRSEVGNALNDKANFENDDKILILDLPKNTQRIELVFLVGNLNCATGGLRVAPVFGSREALEQQRMLMLVLQMLFIGGVLIFGFHYFLLFLLQKQNKVALILAIFCIVTALRSLVWGETPLLILFPNASLELRMYMNYLTGYNYVAIMILFIYSIYPLEFNKKVMGFILFPSLVLDLFILITTPEHMTFYTNYLYLFLILQMLYLIGTIMKSVLRKRDHAIIMFLAVCILIWSINEDIINFIFSGNIYLTCMSLIGIFAVIMTISYVQALQQAITNRKLISYNENLLEAARMKKSWPLNCLVCMHRLSLTFYIMHSAQLPMSVKRMEKRRAS